MKILLQCSTSHLHEQTFCSRTETVSFQFKMKFVGAYFKFIPGSGISAAKNNTKLSKFYSLSFKNNILHTNRHIKEIKEPTHVNNFVTPGLVCESDNFTQLENVFTNSFIKFCFRIYFLNIVFTYGFNSFTVNHPQYISTVSNFN